jgi:hypothetical protein
LGGGDPRHVRVKKKEEDQTENQEIHVDAEDDSSVIHVPTALNAADGVCRARNGGERGEHEQRRRAVVGEVRQEKSGCEAEKDDGASA